jgi:hypothetical protein
MELESVAQMGFSFAVTAYLLYERSGALKENTAMLQSLKDVIASLCEKKKEAT